MNLNNIGFNEYSSNQIMDRFSFYSLHRKCNPFIQRGADIFDKSSDSKTGIQFLKTLLEYIPLWAEKYPNDKLNNESGFKKAYNKLKKYNIQIPSKVNKSHNPFSKVILNNTYLRKESSELNQDCGTKFSTRTNRTFEAKGNYDANRSNDDAKSFFSYDPNDKHQKENILINKESCHHFIENITTFLKSIESNEKKNDASFQEEITKVENALNTCEDFIENLIESESKNELDQMLNLNSKLGKVYAELSAKIEEGKPFLSHNNENKIEDADLIQDNKQSIIGAHQKAKSLNDSHSKGIIIRRKNNK